MPAVDDDSRTIIDQHVKKGKARKFCLIVKGANVVALSVFRKGSFSSKVMTLAKEGLRGEVTQGVVTGSGKNLYFLLPATDEIAALMKLEQVNTKPPTKAAKLREFLTKEELRYKPSFHIIRQPVDAHDPDSATDAPVNPPPPGSEASDDEPAATDAAPPPVAPPVSTSDAPSQPAAAFQAKLAALVPRIKQAAGTPPGDRARALAADAGGLARQQDFVGGLAKLGEAEQALNAAASSAAAPSDDAASRFKSRLVEVLPALRAAQVQPDASGELVALSKQMQEFAAAQKFVQAAELLERLAGLLAAPAAGAADRWNDDAARNRAIALIDGSGKWRALRERLRGELRQVEIAILDVYHGDETFGEAREKAAGIYDLLDRLGEELCTELESVAFAGDDQREASLATARATLASYRAIATSDPLLDALGDNEFELSPIKSDVLAILDEIATLVSPA